MRHSASNFEKLLADDEGARLRAFAFAPGRTVDAVHDWLCSECGLFDSEDFPEHPRRVSRSAVGRWLKRERERSFIAEASELAAAIHTASAEAGTVDVSGAVNLQLAHRLQAAIVKGGEGMDVDDLLRCSRAVNNIANAEQRLRDVRQRFEAAAQELKGRRELTQDDIDRVTRQVFG